MISIYQPKHQQLMRFDKRRTMLKHYSLCIVVMGGAGAIIEYVEFN